MLRRPLGGGFGARNTTTRPRLGPTLSIAPARSLRNRIETGDCPEDDGKVEVDARLDELRGHDPNRTFRLVEGSADFRENRASMCRAHQRGKMEGAFG